MPGTSELICQYCAHRESAPSPRCGNCGAPLSAVTVTAQPQAEPGPSGPTADSKSIGGTAARWEATAEHAAGKAVGEAVGVTRAVSTRIEEMAGRHPAWQWRAVAAVGVAALVFIVVLMTRSCSMPLPAGGPTGADGVGGAVAELRAAATCQRAESDPSSDRCVLDAGSSLLWGEITAGRDLIFTIRTVSPDRAETTVAQWRGAGGMVVADDAVFAAISSSAAIRYADTRAGLVLETGAFAGSSAAQTFLARSGLTR
ncbi:hypothetical protein [Nocardia cyriacigeorgica]|uniref:hypothetical protein n=1 Tax=Nocardia cyriacigeorgica TaxID=135487 RepID=UPI00055FCECB|nr:hypothetical protein [Nocardia cyriacigeorgica]TLF55303.1 hypothetical protein FEK31_21155 [Nocardia cyriacigeorgica]